MLTGYNTDVKHQGIVYHVQTEDGGTDNPFIVSLIYRGGRILASKKTSYAHLLGTENLISQLRDLLEHQHKSMIKSILTDARISGNAAQAVSSSPAMPSAGPPAPGPGQQHIQTPAAALRTEARGETEPADNPKPPLEVPPETGGDASADSAAEKNLDQVILEYLASEIDKD